MSVQLPTSNVQRPTSNEAEQTELPLSEKQRWDEARMIEDAARVEHLLAERAGWVKALEICRALGWAEGESGRRYVRKLSERSDRILSFPGSPGYTLIAAASDDWLAHAVNAIAAQVAVMQARRVRLNNILGLRHAAHQLGDAPLSPFFPA